MNHNGYPGQRAIAFGFIATLAGLGLASCASSGNSVHAPDATPASPIYVHTKLIKNARIQDTNGDMVTLLADTELTAQCYAGSSRVDAAIDTGTYKNLGAIGVAESDLQVLSVASSSPGNDPFAALSGC